MSTILGEAVAAHEKSTTDRPGGPGPKGPRPNTNGAAPQTLRGQVRVEHSAKRIRAYLGGAIVVDSIAPLLVWEVPYYPTYYFSESDVRADLVTDGSVDLHSPSRGDAKT